MMATGTILCAVPGDCWNKQSTANRPAEQLRNCLRDHATIERRLSKNVAVDDESFRYARLSGQIEQVAIGNATFAPGGREFKRQLRAGEFPAVRVGSEYVDLIRTVQMTEGKTGHDTEGRLGSSVFSPGQLSEHVRAFTKAMQQYDFQDYSSIRHRLWFLRKRVLSFNCGLIEVPDHCSADLLTDPKSFSSGGADGRSLWDRVVARFRTNAMPSMLASERRERLESDDYKPVKSSDWIQYGEIRDRGQFMQDRLRSQIRDAIAGGAPVNLMNQRQNMAISIFQEFLHVAPDRKPAHAPVQYDDGRTARPFPFYCLPRLADGWAPTREFHVALISMRHLPLDQYIDMNWYRNVDVPSRSGLAAADEVCYLDSMERLHQLLTTSRGHRIRLHLYHTGYMPAIIGFYRAVVETLSSGEWSPGCLQVIPKLQPAGHGDFVESAPWPA